MLDLAVLLNLERVEEDMPVLLNKFSINAVEEKNLQKNLGFPGPWAS